MVPVTNTLAVKTLTLVTRVCQLASAAHLTPFVEDADTAPMVSRVGPLRRSWRGSAWPGVAVGLSLAAMSWAGAARADEEASPSITDSIEVHGFVSQGFIKTSGNNYLAESKRGSFEFTEVGINFTKGLTDDLRVGMQLFAQDLGPNGDYKPRFDWYYLDYRLRDWFGIRAGRTKIPFGLYNDSGDVDAARVPILLPQSLYPIDHRDYLLAQTGGEAYGNFRLGMAGSLEYRIYGGTLFADPPAKSDNGSTVSKFSVPYVFGGRLMWSPLEGLQLGASYQALRFDWQYNLDSSLVAPLQGAGIIPADSTGAIATKFRVKLWVASLEYQLGNLLLSAEYGRWIGEFESAAPLLLPPHTTNERYYLMASYRVASWFTPGIYYSAYYSNVEKREGREMRQHDLAAFVR
jgi:hypothetical protein